MAGSAPKPFRQRTVTGIGWSVASRLLNQGVSFLVGVVLARLLSPGDFGLITMVMVFVGFATIYLDLGFAAALIERRNATPEHYSSIFWINVAAGLLLMLAFVALSPVVAAFYKEPMLGPLTMLISANYFLGSLRIVQNALFTKALRFRLLTVIEVSAVVLSGAAAVAMALLGMGVWSLAAQSVLSTAIVTTLTWKLSDWRPQARFSWAAVKDLLPFSRNVVAFSSANYWLRNADNLLVGRWLGSSALGIYGRAYSLMLLPLTLISATIGKVMFPALAAIRDDRPRVARVYLRMTRAIALITFPLMIGLLAVADSFVIALYGHQWSGMIPVVKVFCVVGMVQSISTLNGSLYLSQGRADLQLRVGLLLSVVGIGAIVLGLRWGVLGVAVCYGIYSVGSALPGMHVAVSLVGLGITDVLKGLAEVFAHAVAMGAAVYSLGLVLPSDWPPWADLTLRTAFGVAVYAALLYGFRPRAFVDVKDAIRQQLGYRDSVELPFVGAK